MRQGIRDFLLVMCVTSGVLLIGSTLVEADDKQPPSTAEQPAATAAGTPEADPTPVPPAAPTETEEEETPAESPASEDEKPAAAPADEPAKKGDLESEKADDGEVDAPAAGDEKAETEPGHNEKGHGGEAGHGDGDDGHHDPYDLSHVNASPKIEDPSELKSDLAIWTLVVFLLLLALLAKFAWGPIMEGLERREMAIAAAIDEAEQAAAKGAEQLKLYEAKLAAAAEETRELLAKARKDAEVAGERIVSEAQEAAGRERERAIADISAAKNAALQDITERSIDLAVAMAGQMIQRQLEPGDRATLIRDALQQLPNQN